LYYFNTSNKNESGPLDICALDKALTILMCYIPDELQPEHYIYPLRKSITVSINNLRKADISPSEEAPNLPDLSMLTRGEVPLKEEGELVQDFESLQKRRKLLKAMLKNDGWKWDEMVSPKYYDDFEV